MLDDKLEVYQSYVLLQTVRQTIPVLGKMKVKFLIYIVRQSQQSWIARCPATSKVSNACHSRRDVIKDIRNKLAQFLQIEGKKYLSSWKGTPEIINCPEGFIELPIDLWKCKLNKKICPLQAKIFIKDKVEFMVGCLAPGGRKKAIFETIKDSRYEGFHHMPGRYKCPLCVGREYSKYHYPWELTPLSEFFDVHSTEFRIAYIKKGIDLAGYAHSLCPDCFRTVVSKIDLNLENEFDTQELDFFG